MKQRTGIARELFMFMKDNRAFWIAPIILALLFLTAIIILGGTSAAPFIYTLF